MRNKTKKRIVLPRISVDPLFLIIITALLLIDRTGTVPFVLLSVVIHETGHLVCMAVLKTGIKRVCLSAFEVDICQSTPTVKPFHSFLISCMGIVFNLVAFVVCDIVFTIAKSEFFGILAASNLCIGLFNLIPLKSTDGYNILSGWMKSEKGKNLVTIFFTAAITIIGTYIFWKHHNPFMFIFAVMCLATSK